MRRRVTVIGGGASGLAAARAAAKNGADVTLLERLPRVGKKLLLTGGGRCNLAHTPLDLRHYHGSLPQAGEILTHFDAAAFFAEMGLYLRTDAEGRQYPYSLAAASVLDALRFSVMQAGVRVICDSRVTAVTPDQKGFLICCGDAKYRADAVIFAAGGSAAPNCGTDGSLFPILKKLGYEIISPKPALCPIPTDPQLVKACRGLRVRAAVTAECGGKALRTEIGELQFNENALSGICCFDLSRLAAEHGSRLTIAVDLLPDFDAQSAEKMLHALVLSRGTLPCSDLLTGLLPKRVAEQCIKGLVPNLQATARETFFTGDALARLTAQLKAWRFPVAGQAPFAQAQVTAGGVSGACLTQTLESKLHRGAFFCGELLDIDGDCGGYNLLWAWASGDLVGCAAAG